MSGKTYRNALPPGHRLHWYEIEEVLGQGGFGITYLAHDTNLNRRVAIKEYLPADMAVRAGDSSVQPMSPGYAPLLEWGLNRFIVEAQTLARFKHPNIVPVLAVFEDNNTGYMVMNYEHGESLKQRIEEADVTLSETFLRSIVMPILDGLERVHEAGFIHRDLKPDNIFIRSDGTPILLDFGSARQAPEGDARTMTSMVSHGYAPYEQYSSNSEDQGPWTDIYGMGATLYRAVTGIPPAPAIDRSKALLESGRDIYVSAAEIGAGRFSEAFLNAIDHAMAFRHTDRPRSVAQWRQEFTVPSAGTPTVTIRHTPTDVRTVAATGRTKRHGRSLYWLLPLLLVTTGAAGLYRSGWQPPEDWAPWRGDVNAGRGPEETAAAGAETSPPDPRPGLLRSARRHLAADRLVAPEGRNALEDFRRVLELDPDNAAANRGLDRMYRLLLDRAEAAREDGNLREARVRYLAAGRVRPGADEVEQGLLALLQEKLERERLAREQEQARQAAEQERLAREREERARQAEERRRQAEKEKLEQEQELARQREAARRAEEQRRQADREEQQRREELARQREAQQRREALRQETDYLRRLYQGKQALEAVQPEQALEHFRAARALKPDGEEARTGLEQARAMLDTCRSVVGEWQWFNGGRVTFYEDGSVTGRHPLVSDNHGRWECHEPDKRRFILRWEQGGWVNRLTLSRDGDRLAGYNQEGEPVSGRRR